MKTLPFPHGGRLLAGILACFLAIGSSSAADNTAIPTGTLTVDRDLLRVGTRSQLAWQINYPAAVTSVIDILPPNIIKPKKDMQMRVRVLGASFQASILQRAARDPGSEHHREEER
jgi:hypothetical protein